VTSLKFERFLNNNLKMVVEGNKAQVNRTKDL